MRRSLGSALAERILGSMARHSDAIAENVSDDFFAGTAAMRAELLRLAATM